MDQVTAAPTGKASLRFVLLVALVTIGLFVTPVWFGLLAWCCWSLVRLLLTLMLG